MQSGTSTQGTRERRSGAPPATGKQQHSRDGVPRLWVLQPNWPKPPLNLNQRLHWAAQYRLTQEIRQTTKLLARKLKIPPLNHAVVTLIWIVPNRIKRDADNPTPTLKAACDGLVDAGISPDDTPEHMTKNMPQIEYIKGQKAVRIEIKTHDQ